MSKKKRKRKAWIWAAIWKDSNEVFLLNSSLRDLRDDVGEGDKRFRYAKLREVEA